MKNEIEVKFEDKKTREGSFIIKMIVKDGPEEVIAKNIYSQTVARIWSKQFNKDFEGKTLEEIYYSLGIYKDKSRIQGRELGGTTIG